MDTTHFYAEFESRFRNKGHAATPKVEVGGHYL